MVRPRGIDLSYEDLVGSQAEAAAGEDESGGGGFDFNALREFNLEVRATAATFRDLLRLAIAARSGALPGLSAAAGAAAPVAAVGPDPGAMRRSAAVLLGYIEAWAGDVTVLELVNLLARSFGTRRLSELRAALGGSDAAKPS